MYQYDRLPYQSNPFAETHPRNLAMLAGLLGLNPAPAESCRVLELGCAAGGNLIPMAWHLRDSQFVGIDLEPVQVEAGQRMVGALGLGNIVLQQGDITQLGDELGQFDYIIAHGVFSWVPEAVREAMLALYRRLLKAEGVGYISFNARPGWHVRGMLREMLLYHTRDIDDPLAALQAARGFMAMYAETLAGQPGPLAQHLLHEIDSLRGAHPSYLYHEYLEADNQPLLASEFIAQAERHGLRYLCECQLESMFPSHLGGAAEAFLDTLNSTAEHEQYLDFFNHRTFRQSLLVHAERTPQYEIDLERLDDWACASNLVPPARLDLRSDQAQPFRTAEGREVPVSGPLVKAILRALHACYPAAPSIRELLPAAQREVQQAQRGRKVQTGADWHGELFNLYANSLVHLVHRPVAADNRLAGQPRLDELARVCLAQGATTLPTLWHQSLDTDDFSRRVLACLDGRHDLGALLERLLQDLAAGELVMPDLPADPARLRRLLASNLERLLVLFARSGILRPPGDSEAGTAGT
jgi:SAM-dependent methyltransferase